MTRIYHQLGFRYNWNLESIAEDGAGDGVIIAPRYMSKDVVNGLDKDLRKISFFDPQFFIPNSTQGSLTDYDFFPNVIADGFSTSEYSDENAIQSARGCVQFQVAQGFQFVVIPTRYIEGTSTRFIDTQMEMFVAPFLTACNEIDVSKPILLQLVLNDSMVKDESFRTALLNWATGLDKISGVYVIPFLTNRRKQINDIDFLTAFLEFIAQLRKNEMEVIVGYTNTEAMILLAADPTGIALGSYENLRMFNLRSFDESEPYKGRGPSARIYVSQLMQWVNNEYIGAIGRVVENPASFFDDNRYKVLMFTPSYNWHFTKPEPYKHFFAVFARQLRSISEVPMPDRIDVIRQMCLDAKAKFEELEKTIVFETDSTGYHLPAWITSLNLFAKQL